MQIQEKLYCRTFLREMAKRHEKLFPNADLLSQVKKFDEEYQEYWNTEDGADGVKELADCLIVCAGIYRFLPGLGYTAALRVCEMVEDFNEGTIVQLVKKAEEKWLISERRKWQFVDGVYKHVGVDGNE